MRKRTYFLILVFLILSVHTALGREGSKTKPIKGNQKKHSSPKEKLDSDRTKRSLYDDKEALFSKNRGKKLIAESQYGTKKIFPEDLDDNYQLDSYNNFESEQPFWGTRGRRDSSSIENLIEMEYPVLANNRDYLCKTRKNCLEYPNLIERRDEQMLPFWGNRGRRSSDESEDNEPFWGTRGRRQDDSPFWGNRGRRDDTPFWGNRGRRQDDPFWGARGRREDIEPFWGARGRREVAEPFWGARGRRENVEPFWGSRGRREDEPFWGNRGRRQESDPFWGTRGRRKNSEQFWGSRGKKEDSEPFWGNRGKRKGDINIKEHILEAINDVNGDIENLSRLKNENNSDTVMPHQQNFWGNKGRDSKLKKLFNGIQRHRFPLAKQTNKLIDYGKSSKPSASRTVLDDRIYAEEPFYILVERSSRSSREADDPYFITRGKKKNTSHDLLDAVRGRRGALDEIVKSVRNDPFYIARGKKFSEESNNDVIGNSTESNEEFTKAKVLICSTIDLIMMKNEQYKPKREMGDNDRDRRTILKNLAAQLQMDPYFVSRGKKDEIDSEYLEKFIEHVAEMCN